MSHIMGGNQALVDFLQRAIGYGLTGDVSEQVFFIFWGVGANGKSTFIMIVRDMLGDYAMKATSELLMAKRGDAHPTERADLQAKRFVAAVETEEGRRLAEGFVKEATGGDPIRARRMREDFWEFVPTHKLFLATNHKPVVRGTDHAMWRRPKLVPFSVVIPDEEQDKRLAEKLRAELPGILAWSVRGCLDWRVNGLGVPDEVKNATDGYRQEMDVLRDFLDERCVLNPGTKAPVGELYQSYKDWAEKSGEHPLTKRAFGERLRERGLKSGKGRKESTSGKK